MTTVAARLVADSKLLPTEHGFWQEPKERLTDIPEAEVAFTDTIAKFQSRTAIGAEVDILETDALNLQFPGIVMDRTRTRSVRGAETVLKLKHRGYQLLKATPCEPYFFEENGLAETARDAVRINPWDWRLIRNPKAATVDVDASGPVADYVPIEEAITSVFGDTYTIVHRFLDNRLFLPSAVTGAAGAEVQVYGAKPDDTINEEEFPFLQRMRRQAGGYKANPTWLRSIPVENGQDEVTPMPNIDSVDLVLTGFDPGSAGTPEVQVTRNGRAASPTWETVTLSKTMNVLGSGMDAWTGSRTFTGPAGNSLAFRVRLNGSDGDADTVQLHSIRAHGGFVSNELGLTQGTVDAYVDPVGGTGGVLGVDDNFEGMTRLEAGERIRTGTITDPANNPNPHWDLWIDTALAYHFQERKGSDRVDLPSFNVDDARIFHLSVDEFSDDLAYQAIGIGGGKGDNELVVVDDSEFSVGGLYIAANDPVSGNAYGKAAQVRYFVDSSIKSRTELRRRTRAFLHERRVPQTRYEVGFVPILDRDFVAGDAIPVTDGVLGLNALPRVNSLEIEFDARSGHRWNIELGRAIEPARSRLSGQGIESYRSANRAVAAQGSKAVGGEGVHGDKDHFATASLVIPHGIEIKRVQLQLKTLPWQIFSRGGEEEPASTETSTSEEHDHPAADVDVGLGGTTSGAIGEPPFSINVDDDITFPTSASGFEDFGGTFAPSPSASPADIDVVTVFLAAFNNSSNLHGGNILGCRLVRVDTGEVVAESVQNVNSIDTTPQDASDTVTNLWKVLLRAKNSGEILSGKTYKIQFNKIATAGGPWTDDAGAIVDIQYLHGHDVAIGLGGAHAHDVEIPAHQHPIAFGIWQFDGDAGDGDGDPVFGEGIELAVDATVNAAGIPTQFVTEKLPFVFGTEGNPESLTIDITNYLRATGGGLIQPGPHTVHLKSIASASNAKGLFKVSVVPIIEASEVQG